MSEQTQSQHEVVTEPIRALSIVEAAKYLNIGEAYLRTLIRKGRIKTSRVPLREGSIVFKHVIAITELDAWKNQARHVVGSRNGATAFRIQVKAADVPQVREALAAFGIEMAPAYDAKKAKAARIERAARKAAATAPKAAE